MANKELATKVSETLASLCKEALPALAERYADPLRGFAFDCNLDYGEINFCLLSSERAEQLDPDIFGETIEALFDPANWDVANEFTFSETVDENFEQSEQWIPVAGEISDYLLDLDDDTEGRVEIMNVIAEVVANLERDNAFEDFHIVKGFFVTASDQNEEIEEAIERVQRLREISD